MHSTSGGCGFSMDTFLLVTKGEGLSVLKMPAHHRHKKFLCILACNFIIYSDVYVFKKPHLSQYLLNNQRIEQPNPFRQPFLEKDFFRDRNGGLSMCV